MRSCSVERQKLDGVHRQLLRVELRLIVRAGIAGLENFKQLVVSDLQITPADFRQLRGLWALEHFHAVLPVLHFEAELEAGVAPDLLVDHAGRLLSRENQMYAKASAHARGADELFDKVRLLLFELGKFIADDDQVRQRLCRRSLSVKAVILVNVVDAKQAKQLLPPADLAFQGQKRPLRLIDAAQAARFAILRL